MTLPSTGKWAMSKRRDTWIEWFLKLSAVVVLQRKQSVLDLLGVTGLLAFQEWGGRTQLPLEVSQWSLHMRRANDPFVCTPELFLVTSSLSD